MKAIVFSTMFFCLALQTNAQRYVPLDISSFQSIDIFGAFEVELIKAEKAAVEVDYNGVHRDNIIAEVYRGKLKLKLKNRHYIDDWTSSSYDYRPSTYVKVRLYYTELESIIAMAGANIQSDEVIKYRDFEIEAGMGAIVNLKMLNKHLYVKTSMGSEVFLKGKTDELEVNATMGGVLTANALESKFAQVRANMGADVHINATEEIDASAGFGAVIRYAGGPNVKNTSTNFGGEVRPRR